MRLQATPHDPATTGPHSCAALLIDWAPSSCCPSAARCQRHGRGRASWWSGWMRLGADDQLDGFFDYLVARPRPRPAGGAAPAPRPGPHEPRAAENLLAPDAKLVEPPRQELLRRLNRAPGGTAADPARCAAQAAEACCRARPELQALESRPAAPADQSWFNPGFLQMQPRGLERSPAQLLEKLILHEAVHADGRLGRPAPPVAARPPLLRILPPPAARRAADLRGSGTCCPTCRRPSPH